MKAYLALEDGTVFEGESFGAKGSRLGEVVFNTSMTGYQEILTDPSYCGQIVVMTYPLIGNYGINPEDWESAGPQVRGFAVRELCDVPSNWRSTGSLDGFLKEHNIIGIQGIDTRSLTRRLRSFGTMRGIITTEEKDYCCLADLARQAPIISGQDMVSQVTTITPYSIAGEKDHMVLMDFGVKRNIVRWLRKLGYQVTVVPASTTRDEIIRLNPDGIILSNGPGDPKGVLYAAETVKGLLGIKPIFGICLGHQLLGLALGADTVRMRFGHRGANHPVKDLNTGQIYITSQNHGFTIDPDSIDQKEVEISHINLNDETVEGIRCKNIPAFSVQYHPEAFPGPTDSEYLFWEFLKLVEASK